MSPMLRTLSLGLGCALLQAGSIRIDEEPDANQISASKEVDAELVDAGLTWAEGAIRGKTLTMASGAKFDVTFTGLSTLQTIVPNKILNGKIEDGALTWEGGERWLPMEVAEANSAALMEHAEEVWTKPGDPAHPFSMAAENPFSMAGEVRTEPTIFEKFACEKSSKSTIAQGTLAVHATADAVGKCPAKTTCTAMDVTCGPCARSCAAAATAWTGFGDSVFTTGGVCNFDKSKCVTSVFLVMRGVMRFASGILSGVSSCQTASAQPALCAQKVLGNTKGFVEWLTQAGADSVEACSKEDEHRPRHCMKSAGKSIKNFIAMAHSITDYFIQVQSGNASGQNVMAVTKRSIDETLTAALAVVKSNEICNKARDKAIEGSDNGCLIDSLTAAVSGAPAGTAVTLAVSGCSKSRTQCEKLGTAARSNLRAFVSEVNQAMTSCGKTDKCRAGILGIFKPAVTVVDAIVNTLPKCATGQAWDDCAEAVLSVSDNLTTWAKTIHDSVRPCSIKCSGASCEATVEPSDSRYTCAQSAITAVRGIFDDVISQAGQAVKGLETGAKYTPEQLQPFVGKLGTDIVPQLIKLVTAIQDCMPK